MATDVFMKIGTYKGESLDAKHKGEIDVLGWSWGIHQDAMVAGGGLSAGKASFQDLSFSHNIDAASPNLMMACVNGEHIKEATLTARKAGKTAQEFLIIKMTDVLITNVAPSGDGSAHTQEQVSMKFGKVALEYKPQKADGNLDSGIQFKWDISGNVKV
jgi:type VI secretion system secreted protein Hcp